MKEPASKSDRPRCERCRYRKTAKGKFWVCTKCAYWMKPYSAKRRNVRLSIAARLEGISCL